VLNSQTIGHSVHSCNNLYPSVYEENKAIPIFLTTSESWGAIDKA